MENQSSHTGRQQGYRCIQSGQKGHQHRGAEHGNGVLNPQYGLALSVKFHTFLLFVEPSGSVP